MSDMMQQIIDLLIENTQNQKELIEEIRALAQTIRQREIGHVQRHNDIIGPRPKMPGFFTYKFPPDDEDDDEEPPEKTVKSRLRFARVYDAKDGTCIGLASKDNYLKYLQKEYSGWPGEGLYGEEFGFPEKRIFMLPVESKGPEE